MSKTSRIRAESLYRCLAHIINLATQAVISSRSKSKYYSGDPGDDIVPEDADTGDRDEIGIIRAICAKVRLVSILVSFNYLYLLMKQARSSSQRKQLLKSVQERLDIRPRQLLLDMKVRWSSTYVMLIRAESQRKVSFILSQLCGVRYLMSLGR
jgi:hypothetical protein